MCFIVMAVGTSKKRTSHRNRKLTVTTRSDSPEGYNTKCMLSLLLIPCADYIQQAAALDPSKV
jgi:hypothetical protein